MIDVHLSMDPKTRQSISSVAYIISYAETNSKAYNLTKSLIKEVFFLERGEGVQSDLENCAYLWKNLGYAPDPSTRSLSGSTLSYHKQTWRGNNRYWQRAQCDELRKLLRSLLNPRQWIHLALETEHILTKESQNGRRSLNRRKIIIPKTSRIAWSRDLVSYQLRYWCWRELWSVTEEPEYLFIFLPAFLDTDLPRGNVHELDSRPMRGVIPTQSYNQ